MEDQRNSRPAIVLLVVGAIAGVMLAAAGLLEGKPEVSPGQVARINDTLISVSQLDEYASQINANTPVPRDKNFLLNQMIDEELLVQRGVELGLVRQSTPVRNAIIEAVTRRFGSSAPDVQITETELLAYYEQNIDQFLPPAVYTVLVITPASPSGASSPLTYPSLIARFGPSLAAEIARLRPGEQTSTSGDTVVRLIETQGGEAPPFERVRNLVQENLKRELALQAFREYLAWLRQRAEVDLRPQ